MILPLSWKNIWRSKRRSFVVIGAIIIGVWALIFMIAFYNSFGDAFVRNAVNHEHSHIQVHNPEYLADPKIDFVLDDITTLERRVAGDPIVKAYSSRVKVNGMIASTKTSTGIQVYGVEPELEARTTELDSQLVAGSYFEKVSRNPILISAKLADKLKVKIRSKIVLTFQDVDNNITAASYRIEGIFDTKSPKINESVVYVKKEDISDLVGVYKPHELAVLLKNGDNISSYRNDLDAITDNKVRTYKEVAPEFNLMEESSNMTKLILTIIIMLALLFGIVNTMLMAVLERTKEIGMLRSIGMHKRKVFGMIVLETLLLGIISGPVGLLLGFITIAWLGNTGLDMSMYADALKEYGYEAIFYPQIDTDTYFLLMMVVIVTALIGAIYPAIKAISLNPLEAIRKL